jgi:NAD(P)-dependent dehydrogenase (short-subunit alcohol dehydrogenase family)
MVKQLIALIRWVACLWKRETLCCNVVQPGIIKAKWLPNRHHFIPSICHQLQLTSAVRMYNKREHKNNYRIPRGNQKFNLKNILWERGGISVAMTEKSWSLGYKTLLILLPERQPE